MNYTALQIKTSYSILESLNNINELVSRASSLGYTSLAITDKNNLFGVMEFYLECKKHNIKPIIGMEINNNDIKLLVYAINKLGYNKLIKIATNISEGNFDINSIIDDNLIVIIPYEYFNSQLVSKLKYVYIGYSNTKDRDQITNYKKVFINDVSYLEKEDYKYLDYLLMIKEAKIIGEYELNTHKNKHLMDFNEVSLLSPNEDILNTKEIADMCNVSLEYEEGLLPIYDKEVNSFEYLSMLCNKGLKRRLNNNVTNKYQKRLDDELSIINKMGFCDYFLVVWDYVKYAKFNNILVGPGRGSAAGSLVSYTLGITDIDPLKYDLLFERFLNPERITMPDIDIDFDNEKIDYVIDYVTSKYGKKKVAGIITFSRMTAKQVVRDVCRVLKINLAIVDEVSRLIIKPTLSENYSENTNFKKLINSNEELKKMYAISLKLEGLIRNPSMHAAGIVMCKKDIDSVIPLYKNDDGMYLTAFTKDYLEPLGLLKMDFLRLATLSFIADIIDNIKKNEKINITFEKIPMDDVKTLQVFYNVDTDGIFQFESFGMKQFLSKLKVSSFDDIVAAIALYRPGPMDNIDAYIRRKEGKEKVIYPHPSLEPILKSTYGIIIYQEQIMQIASLMAGYSYGEADVLRRAMSKKDSKKLADERPKFISQCITKGYTTEVANYVFDLIFKFADYGFNKSHSVAYAVIGYKMAFLKYYFPKYFITSSLTNVIGNENKTKNYIREARVKKVNVLPPDINKSKDKYSIENIGIRCPLTIIRNVGKIGYYEISNARDNEPFQDFIDFVVKCYSQSLNKKALIYLIYAGCFNSFGYNKRTLIENLDVIINYAELAKDSGILELEKPFIEVFEEYSNDELISFEFDAFGFYLSNHPTSCYKKKNDVDLINLEHYYDKIVSVVIFVDRIKEIFTKKNEVMAFVEGYDDTSLVNVTLFPKVYAKFNSISKGNIIRVIGKVERRYDKIQLIGNNIELLK